MPTLARPCVLSYTLSAMTVMTNMSSMEIVLINVSI